MRTEDPREDYHIEGYCATCGAAVLSVSEECGIGSYEFWGASGNDRAYCEVSPCCRGDVLPENPFEGGE